jgi:hypothetical protein
MHQIAGEHSQAVFAADGRARHRLVRAAVAAGVALLAAWLIALALGVLGGFGSLPSLTGSASSEPKAANSQIKRVERPSAGPAQAPDLRARRPAEDSVQTSTPTQATGLPSPGRTQNSTPKTTSKAPVSPSAPATTGSASNSGRRLGTTNPTTTGKPVGSPGNGPGGSGAPGRLR